MCQERLECVNDFREKIMLINVAEKHQRSAKLTSRKLTLT